MRLKLTIAFAMLSAALAAHADTQTFLITFTAGLSTATITASGTTDPLNAAAFDLTSASGTLNGLTLSLLPAGPGTNSGNAYSNFAIGLFYDNVVYPSGASVLDGAGLAFTDGVNAYNPFYDASGSYSGLVGYSLDTHVGSAQRGGYTPTSVTVAVSPTATTPEPSTFTLLGTGLLCAVGMVKRRFV